MRHGLLLLALACPAYTQELGPALELTDALPAELDSAVLDLDGNGALDLLLVGYHDLTWLPGVGGGSLARSRDLAGDLGGVGSLAAGGLDGDGDPDLLVTLYDQVAWMRNLAGPNFGDLMPLPGLVYTARSAVFADLDGDGDADVLASSGNGNSVYWNENLLNPSQGTPYCDPAELYSTGAAGSLSAVGSPWIPERSLTLHATSLPAGQTGLFLTSLSPGFVANPGGSQGNLCLGGAIGRFVGPGQVQASSAAGELSLSLDLSALPTPSGTAPALSGDTWPFQLWYRYQNPGPTSNISSGLALTFL